jgi:hypothetical protein
MDYEFKEWDRPEVRAEIEAERQQEAKTRQDIIDRINRPGVNPNINPAALEGLPYETTGEVLNVIRTTNPDKFIVQMQLKNAQAGQYRPAYLNREEVLKMGGEIPLDSNWKPGGEQRTEQSERKKKEKTEKEAKEKKPEPELVEVGINTRNPEYIEKKEAERIKKESPTLWDTLKRDGIESYNQSVKAEYTLKAAEVEEKNRVTEEKQRKADAKRAADDKAAVESVSQLEKETMGIVLSQLPGDLRDAYLKGGVEGYNKAVENYNLEVAKQNAALDKLKPYTSKDGSVDVYKYLKDAEMFKESFAKGDVPGYIKEEWKRTHPGEPVPTKAPDYDPVVLLKEAGFTDADIKEGKYYADLKGTQRLWQGATPWDEYKGEKATAKGVIVMAAETLAPGYYVATHWKDMTTAEKVIAIGIDASIFGGVALRGATIGARTVAGTATRAGVMAAAGKGAVKEVAAMVTAPVNVILHPVGTAKATAADIRNLIENIANPKKLPAMSVYTSDGTVRLAIKGEMTEARALAIRDQLMDAVKKGERAFVKVGDQTIELERSALMKELPGSFTHTTPGGNVFEDVLKVAKKEGMSAKEQGLFISPDPLPRFSTSSAFGKAGEQPTMFIISPETAAKSVNTGKVYDSAFGKVVEMEHKLPVGAAVKGVGQKFYTRIGANGTRVEIWLEEGVKLSPLQIAKLKAKSIIETAKAMYTPALRVSGKDVTKGLTRSETELLAKELRRAGATREARDLLRAEKLIRSARYSAPALARLARAKPEDIRRELENLRRTPERVEPRRLQRIEITAADLRRMVREERSQRDTPRQDRRESLREEPRRIPPREEPRRVPPPDEGRRVPPPDDTRRTPPPDEGRRIPPPEEARRIPPLDAARRVPPLEPPRREPPRVEPPRPPPGKGRILPSKGGTDEKKDWTPEEVKSAIAWRDGIVVHAIRSPYRRGIDERSYNVNNLPAGMIVMQNYKGKGSQSRSAKVTGKFPGKLTVDVGNQDVVITKNKGRVNIRHFHDTRHSSSMTTISKKRGRIYRTRAGGSEIFSRRPMKGY